jgi:triosephosphate isomerase
MHSFYILGNWKSNGTAKELAEFVHQWNTPAAASTAAGLGLPFTLLSQAKPLLADAGLTLGAQNVSATGSGAFTGEIHAGQLSGVGVDFGIIGHSERRHLFGETSDVVTKKLNALVAAGILPVLCIGETLEERQGGRLEQVLTEQLTSLTSLDSTVEVILAYEPVWAIGTGVAATHEDVAQTHHWITAHLNQMGRTRTPILYGGSVKPDNAGTLASIDSLHGFLIGGASLEADSFGAILKAFDAAKH